MLRRPTHFKKIELIYLFTELNQSKKELHDIYSKKGFKSNKDSKNPLSSLINAVWVDNENEILKTALSKIDRSSLSVLPIDKRYKEEENLLD